MKISTPLRVELACFIARIIMDQFEDSLALATALETLCEALWIEIEESLPPSAKLE